MTAASDTWKDLYDRMFEAVDVRWFAPVDPDLARAAIGVPAGRRRLWRALLAGDRLPNLFDPTRTYQAPTDHCVALVDTEQRRHVLLELGALAHAGVIRTLVDRQSVLQLRSKLGEPLYLRVLRQRAGTPSPAIDADDQRIRLAARHPRQLRALIRRRGAHEVGAFLDRTDPPAADLLAACCPPTWRRGGWLGTLPAGMVAERLEEAVRVARRQPS